MTTPPSSSPKTERRRSPRIEILGRVEGVVRPLDVSITVLNVSLGGFMMQTSHQYGVGETHEFQLKMRGKSPFVVRARIAHALRVTVEHRAMHLYGLEFVDEAAGPSQQTIQSWIAALESSDSRR